LQAANDGEDVPSARIMGIGVRSTDQDVKGYTYTNNVLYYAEVMFQGVPN
jgi:hypothetical protein